MNQVSTHLQKNFELSNNMTISPRLEYCIYLLDLIQNQLKKREIEITNLNKNIGSNMDEKTYYYLQLEEKISFAIESLEEIHKRVESISIITNIPTTIPSIIPAIRTISSTLFEIMPNCSHELSELSILLGSITIDSATITEAKFDFRQSNIESNIILDEAKLMADSKIRKQYPNLDFPTEIYTCQY